MFGYLISDETRFLVFEILLLAAALDFHVFVVQTNRLKQLNPKQLERTRCFWTQNKETNEMLRTGALSR